MWVTKLDRTRLFANQAYVDFLGLPYEEAIKFDWRKILHPDDLQHILQESVAGEASLKPFVLEARYRRADGEWRWLRSESQPRWDPTGKHIGFIGVAHDVTAAKQAEIDLRSMNEILEQRIAERTAQLESSEAQMRAIFETSNQYQALLNRQGQVVYVNRTALVGSRYPVFAEVQYDDDGVHQAVAGQGMVAIEAAHSFFEVRRTWFWIAAGVLVALWLGFLVWRGTFGRSRRAESSP